MKKFFVLLLIMVLLVPVLCARHRTEVYLSGMSDSELKARVQTNFSNLISEANRAFAAKKPLDLSKVSITPEARNALNEMWKVQSFICPETELIRNVLSRTDGLWEVRDIPILYETKSKNARDDEIVIVFDSTGAINGLLIALDKEKYTKLFADSYTLKDRRLREIILNFLENFRTAYNRKDITYIEEVYSDDALIIVGKVISSNKQLPDQKGGPQLSDGKQIEYVRLSKNEYITNLKALFKRNKIVKVEFAEFKIQRHPTFDYMFGVQLFQKWRSSTYGDDGFLFLLIDLRKEEEPLIWVRTWQPGEYFDADKAFDLADFIIN